MGGRGSKIVQNCVTSFMDDPKAIIVLFFTRLTSRCLISVIGSRAKLVKKLSFKNCSLEGSALRRLGEVADLSLEELDLSRCAGIGQDAMLDFCRHQNKLVKLNIDWCRRILVTFSMTWNVKLKIPSLPLIPTHFWIMSLSFVDIAF